MQWSFLLQYYKTYSTFFLFFPPVLLTFLKQIKYILYCTIEFSLVYTIFYEQ